MTDRPVLQVEDLVVAVRTKQGRVDTVRGISFALHKGQTLALVGESGCGKSLTALALLRLLAEPHVAIRAGRILFHGTDLAGLPDRRMRRIRGGQIAMIFQDPMATLNPVMAVGAQIVEALRLHQSVTRHEAEARALAVLARVGIPDPARRLRQFPHQLSGGMRQRVVIAMALVTRPEVLIADEPTTALDATVQAQVLELLDELKDEYGMALLLITHDLGVVAEIADRVMVMYAGRVVEEAATAALFAAPAHPYTRGLLAATPRVGGGGVAALQAIPGVVPPPWAFPPGCAFAPRCDLAMDRCRDAMPLLQAVAAPGHGAACFALPERG